jgi:hypothetical protein
MGREQAVLAASEAGQLTFLTGPAGKPFTPTGFTSWFGTSCRAAGLPLGLSAHGLRKAMCRRLAEEGCSANQIAAVSGHTTLREVSRYTKAADQKRLAIAAMHTLEQTAFQTASKSDKPQAHKVTNRVQVIEKKGPKNGSVSRGRTGRGAGLRRWQAYTALLMMCRNC